MSMNGRAGMGTEQLRVRAREKELLHGIDVEFPRHEVSAIIGPTGCGRTTLLRTLNRRPAGSAGMSVGGRVTLAARDIYRDFANARELRHRVGMLFQRPSPFPQSI